MFPAISGIYEEGNKSREKKSPRHPHKQILNMLLIQKIKIKLTKVKEVEDIRKIRLKMGDLIEVIFK